MKKTEQLRKKISTLHKKGKTGAFIAQKLGISKPTVYKYIKSIKADAAISVSVKNETRRFRSSLPKDINLSDEEVNALNQVEQLFEDFYQKLEQINPNKGRYKERYETSMELAAFFFDRSYILDAE